MVLSNKKLKQKLRTAKADSLTTTVIVDHDSNKTLSSIPNPQPNPELQQLLEAAKQRPRLSKREKRRKSQKPNSENGEISKKSEEDDDKGLVSEEGGEDGQRKKREKRKRKRKREEGESEGNVLEEKDKNKQKKVNKKKKKKKKKKSKKEKAKSGEEMDFDAGVSNATVVNAASESQINEDLATKVYVGGIPYYSTEDDIRSFFESCGTITEVDCMTFPDSGKFRGIAIVSFKTEAASKRALALDGADMGGFFLKIQPYKATRANKVASFTPEMIKGYNRIYAGNLSWDVTEDDLRKFFADCNISSIRFGMDKETGEFRGYAHVDFTDNLSLEKALKLDQQIVCGRPIKISCAVPLKKAKMDSAARPTSTATANNTPTSTATTNNTPKNEEITANNNEIPARNDGTSISSGKIRRRTCYECGEKGHISSDCPKKQTSNQTIAVYAKMEVLPQEC